jgi:S1-C subfamily serine protease
MDESAKPASQPAEEPKKEEESEALIFTPISIARARHASEHGDSVLNKSRSSQQKTPPPKKEKKAASSKSKAALPPGAAAATSASSPFSGAGGCFIASFLVGAFVVGGILGGMVGGSLLLWANTSGVLVFAADTPPPTLTPSPTPAPAATATLTPTPEPVPTLSIEDVIASVIPSVVTVINQHQDDFASNPILDESQVVGSGVIIDSRGYIVTNNHVVDTPQNINVILSDGRELKAELVAASPAEDLAILKIKLKELPIVEWGTTDKVRPGQMVYAIGSPLGDFPSSVSFGIISGLNRALEIDRYVIDGLIQTDAAINRGSSGGPLINLEGQVIGINTFIIRESEERGIAEGIAFAIPAETAKNLLIPWIAAHTGESVPIPASEETE